MSKCQKIVKFLIFGLFIILNCERTCDLTDVQASNYDSTETRDYVTIQLEETREVIKVNRKFIEKVIHKYLLAILMSYIIKV